MINPDFEPEQMLDDSDDYAGTGFTSRTVPDQFLTQSEIQARQASEARLREYHQYVKECEG